MDSLSKKTNRGGGGESVVSSRRLNMAGKKFHGGSSRLPLATINIAWLKTVRFISRRCFCVHVTTTKHDNFTRYKFQLGRVLSRFNQRREKWGEGTFLHTHSLSFLYFFISLSLSFCLSFRLSFIWHLLEQRTDQKQSNVALKRTNFSVFNWNV